MVLRMSAHDPDKNPTASLAMRFGAECARSVMAALAEDGFVCVPRQPTPRMVDDAWMAAGAERADLVWRDMIETYEQEIRKAM